MGLAATLTINALWALGAFILFYGTGNRVWHLVCGADRSRSQDIVMSASTGVGVVSFLLLGLSLLGRYRAGPIMALSVALLLAALPPAARLLASLFRSDRWGLSRSSWLLVGSLGLLTAVEFLRSCLPNTVRDTYHYALPLQWLRHGAMFDTGSTLYDGLTHATHLVFGAGLALGGDAAANKISLLALVVCLIGCVALSRAAGWDRRTGIYAAAILAAVHSFAAEGGAGGLVDIHVLMFTIAAAVSAFRWLRGARTTYAVIFAVMLALAGGTKQYGWLVAASLMVAVLVSGLASGQASRTVRVGPWVLAAFLGASVPWLVWSYQVTGNPLYPLGSSMKTLGLGGVTWAQEATDRGFERTLLTYVTYPWHLTLNFTLLRSSWSYGIGPALIAFAPLAIFYRKRSIALAACGLFLLCYLSVTFFIAPHMVRYIMPALALAALVAASAADALRRANGSPPAIRLIVPLLLLCPVLLAAGIEAGRLTPWEARACLLGRISADDYRARHHNLPGYALIVEANELLPLGARVLVLGMTGYRLDSSYVELPRFLLDGVGPEPPTARNVTEAIGRLGITHIISSIGPEQIAQAMLEINSELTPTLVDGKPPPGYSLSVLEAHLSDTTGGAASGGPFDDGQPKRPTEVGAMLLVALCDNLHLLWSSESVPFGHVYVIAGR